MVLLVIGGLFLIFNQNLRVSHLKERKEKICLNCNANLYGRFCHVCGQENLEPKETVWHLVSHFFNDITHFDGKFFTTVKYLITRPGFLSTEYIIGRRASYLNPIRMYVFTSAFFFLVLFSMTGAGSIMKITDHPENEAKEKKSLSGIRDWEKQKTTLLGELKNNDADSEDIHTDIHLLDFKIATAKKIYGDTSTRKFDRKEVVSMLMRAGMDSLKSVAAAKGYSKNDNISIFMDDMDSDKYRTVSMYDSIQKSLPADRKDGWLKKILYREIIKINEQVRKDKNTFFEQFRENFLHSFPKILFFSLPFFALILKFVYIRRKNFYYVDHAIFSIDLYCATFILMLMSIILNTLQENIPWEWLRVITGILSFITWLYMFIYTYKAMRRFYKQGRFKTFVKFILVGFMALIVDVFLMLIFLAISAISV